VTLTAVIAGVFDCGWFVIMGTGGGAAFTVTTAAELVAIPPAFETRTVYDPESAICALVIESDDVVLPESATVPFNHWYESAVPVAITLSEIVPPVASV